MSCIGLDHEPFMITGTTETKITKGSELQYKCRIFWEFSIENAEIMEKCP